MEKSEGCRNYRIVGCNVATKRIGSGFLSASLDRLARPYPLRYGYLELFDAVHVLPLRLSTLLCRR
jgi:hypothetical protein